MNERTSRTANLLPLLVLLPGLDGTGKLFANFIAALGGTAQTLILDYPADRPLGYEALERRVRDALPTDRPFIVLGESFSGPIAIRIAASPPAGMRGVILCGTFASNPYPWLGWASPLSFLVPLKSLPRWVRAPLMWGSKSAAETAQIPARAERAIAHVDGKVVRRRIAALLTVDATDALKKIALPALVVYAVEDRVVSYAATQRIMRHLPGATIAAIDGPHLLLQARPEACAAVVLTFLRNQSVD